jgi:hypothetical protein
VVQLAPPSLPSEVEELVAEILGSQASDKATHATDELGRETPPGDHNARMIPSRLEPETMETFEVDAVVGEERTAGSYRDGQLFLI